MAIEFTFNGKCKDNYDNYDATYTVLMRLKGGKLLAIFDGEITPNSKELKTCVIYESGCKLNDETS